LEAGINDRKFLTN